MNKILQRNSNPLRRFHENYLQLIYPLIHIGLSKKNLLTQIKILLFLMALMPTPVMAWWHPDTPSGKPQITVKAPINIVENSIIEKLSLSKFDKREFTLSHQENNILIFNSPTTLFHTPYCLTFNLFTLENSTTIVMDVFDKQLGADLKVNKYEFQRDMAFLTNLQQQIEAQKP